MTDLTTTKIEYAIKWDDEASLPRPMPLAQARRMISLMKEAHSPWSPRLVQRTITTTTTDWDLAHTSSDCEAHGNCIDCDACKAECECN